RCPSPGLRANAAAPVRAATSNSSSHAAAPSGTPASSTSTSAKNAGAATSSRPRSAPSAARMLDPVLGQPAVQALAADPKLVDCPLQVAPMDLHRPLEQPGFRLVQRHCLKRGAGGRPAHGLQAK